MALSGGDQLMEPSNKKRKIIERCLLWLMLGIVGWAAAAQFSSRTAQILVQKKNESVRVSVFTSPAMLVAYNPATQKAVVSVGSGKCNPQHRQSCLSQGTPSYYIPQTSNREEFWELFKHGLSQWRYNPLLAVRTAWAYLTAWHDNRTNLSPAEFVLFALELSKLEPSDFAVKLPPAKKRGRKAPAPKDSLAPAVADMAPLAVKDRPIVVEILNASGKKGLALKLTQYLREQNAKGQLRVDVLQYDNFPTQQEESVLVDFSGRLVQVKQLSQAIGINGEIRSETSPNAICDTRIILGKDFEMPL